MPSNGGQSGGNMEDDRMTLNCHSSELDDQGWLSRGGMWILHEIYMGGTQRKYRKPQAGVKVVL